MQRLLISSFLLAAALIVGCGAPAEVKTNTDAIPTILPGRSAPKGDGEAATPTKGGRTLTAPK